MPTAPPRPCVVCGRIHCPQHQVAPWRTHRPPVARIRGRQLQAMRARLFATQPWCAICLERGHRTPATVRDHVIPLAEGGRDDETNEQALCQICSDGKTREEARRGMQRR